MRKYWRLSMASVLGLVATCLAIEYGARHPDTWLGRRTTSLAKWGLEYNPLGLFGSPASSGSSSSRPTDPVGIESDPAKLPDGLQKQDAETLVEATELVGTLKLDVQPIEPTVMPEHEYNDPLFGTLPPPHETPLPNHMPRAHETIESVAAISTILAESPELTARMPYADEVETNPHHCYHGCPYLGCPYPFPPYLRPSARPSSWPPNGNVQDKPIDQRMQPSRLLEKWLSPWQWFNYGATRDRSVEEALEIPVRNPSGVSRNGRQ